MSLSPMPSSSVNRKKPTSEPGQAQQDRDEEAARIVSGHECLGDESGQEAEDDCSDHVPLLPAQSTGMPCRIVFSVTTRGSTN